MSNEYLRTLHKIKKLATNELLHSQDDRSGLEKSKQKFSVMEATKHCKLSVQQLIDTKTTALETVISLEKLWLLIHRKWSASDRLVLTCTVFVNRI